MSVIRALFLEDLRCFREIVIFRIRRKWLSFFISYQSLKAIEILFSIAFLFSLILELESFKDAEKKGKRVKYMETRRLNAAFPVINHHDLWPNR